MSEIDELATALGRMLKEQGQAETRNLLGEERWGMLQAVAKRVPKCGVVTAFEILAKAAWLVEEEM